MKTEYRHSRITRAWRRWLFRRLFKQYKLPAQARPNDGDSVVVLDEDNSHNPVWIAEYNAEYNSYQAGGGWFEASEVTYWAPMRQVNNKEPR